jgi:leucine dehydrogenase
VKERAMSRARGIYDTLTEIIAVAKDEHIPTFKAADRLAERRIEKIRLLRRFHTPSRRKESRSRR